MYPDPMQPVPITLAECEDLAADEGARNGWELAARFAARLLPQIFRPESPIFLLALPPEHQRKLEQLLAELPEEVFFASDSLGWVYQFWQAKKKDEINASEVKIGARELPVVTQLFTEPYMVSFLLDNSLGAWWAARRLSEDDLRHARDEEELRQKASLPGVPLDYLRFVRGEDGPQPCECVPNSGFIPRVQGGQQSLIALNEGLRFIGERGIQFPCMMMFLFCNPGDLKFPLERFFTGLVLVAMHEFMQHKHHLLDGVKRVRGDHRGAPAIVFRQGEGCPDPIRDREGHGRLLHKGIPL